MTTSALIRKSARRASTRCHRSSAKVSTGPLWAVSATREGRRRRFATDGCRHYASTADEARHPRLGYNRPPIPRAAVTGRCIDIAAGKPLLRLLIAAADTALRQPSLRLLIRTVLPAVAAADNSAAVLPAVAAAVQVQQLGVTAVRGDHIIHNASLAKIQIHPAITDSPAACSPE